MVRTTLQAALCLLLSPLLVAQQTPGSTGQAPDQNPSATTRSSKREIPKGTRIPLVLLDPLSSATAQKGQTIRFAVARDVVVDGTTVIRRGAAATGIVTKARKAVAGKRDGYVWFDLVSLTLPGGPLTITHYVQSESADGGDGWCWGFGSCLVLLVMMYTIYFPIQSVKDLFDRPHPSPISTNDETKAACSPTWAVTKTIYAVRSTQSVTPLNAEGLDATCPMSKDEFHWVGAALELRQYNP